DELNGDCWMERLVVAGLGCPLRREDAVRQVDMRGKPSRFGKVKHLACHFVGERLLPDQLPLRANDGALIGDERGGESKINRDWVGCDEAAAGRQGDEMPGSLRAGDCFSN